MRELRPEEKEFINNLYLKKYDKLYNYAQKLMSGSAAAEDIVQDTFLMFAPKLICWFSTPTLAVGWWRQ